jgi:hypothetical protein
MVTQFTRGVMIGIGLFAIVACTPVVAPETAASPEVTATLSSQPAQAATRPVTGVMTPETEEETMTPQPANNAKNHVTALSVEDLAERLSIAVDQIKVLEVRAVTWPDAGLGCPQPGMVYVQVSQEGWLIRLGAGGEMYFYHSGRDQKPFLCEQLSQIIPNITPKVDELIPPPDSEID